MRTLLIFHVVILRRLIRRRNHNHNSSIPPPATPVLATEDVNDRYSERWIGWKIWFNSAFRSRIRTIHHSTIRRLAKFFSAVVILLYVVHCHYCLALCVIYSSYHRTLS